MAAEVYKYMKRILLCLDDISVATGALAMLAFGMTPAIASAQASAIDSDAPANVRADSQRKENHLKEVIVTAQKFTHNGPSMFR